MKQNSAFTSFLVFLITAILFGASLAMTSCSGVRYSYYNKQKMPYTATEEIKLAKTIPAKPFLSQAENELKGKVAPTPDKSSKQKDAAPGNTKKAVFPVNLQEVLSEKSIAKYIPLQPKNIQSENKMNVDRELMIVLLVVLILVVIALLGDELLWLLFLALLVILIYALVKYLGIFN